MTGVAPIPALKKNTGPSLCRSVNVPRAAAISRVSRPLTWECRKLLATPLGSRLTLMRYMPESGAPESE